MWTDAKELQDFVVPKEMTIKDIIQTENEFVAAAKHPTERDLVAWNCTGRMVTCWKDFYH